MNIKESAKMAFAAIRSNRMRTFLTMLGIIIGISSVIALVTLGNGNKEMMTKEFSSYGANRATIYTGGPFKEDDNRDYSSYYITKNDLDMVNRIYGDKLEGISTSEGFNGTFSEGRKDYTMSFQAVNSSYKNIDNINIIEGKFFSKEDVENERQVIVIDKKMADEYFKGKSPIGKRLITDVNGQTEAFRIIGVYEKKESTMNREKNNTFQAYAPSSIGKRINETENYMSVEFNVKENEDVESIGKNIISILEKKHNVVGEKIYNLQTMKSQMEMMNKFTGSMTIFIAAIAAISLLVGGIGIMNIMLVSVTERTREIGIRKAIGAKKRDILMQFIIEAISVSGLGGIIGIVFGLGLANIGTKLLRIPMTYDIKIMLIAFAFSSLIGVFFGLYPANKAAKLNTIDALRYE